MNREKIRAKTTKCNRKWKKSGDLLNIYGDERGQECVSLKIIGQWKNWILILGEDFNQISDLNIIHFDHESSLQQAGPFCVIFPKTMVQVPQSS